MGVAVGAATVAAVLGTASTVRSIAGLSAVSAVDVSGFAGASVGFTIAGVGLVSAATLGNIIESSVVVSTRAGPGSIGIRVGFLAVELAIVTAASVDVSIAIGTNVDAALKVDISFDRSAKDVVPFNTVGGCVEVHINEEEFDPGAMLYICASLILFPIAIPTPPLTIQAKATAMTTLTTVAIFSLATAAIQQHKT